MSLLYTPLGHASRSDTTPPPTTSFVFTALIFNPLTNKRALQSTNFTLIIAMRARPSAYNNSQRSQLLVSFVTSTTMGNSKWLSSKPQRSHTFTFCRYQQTFSPCCSSLLYTMPSPLVPATPPHLTSSWPAMVLTPLYNAITARTSHSSTPDFLMAHHGSHFTIQCHHRLYQPLLHAWLPHGPPWFSLHYTMPSLLVPATPPHRTSSWPTMVLTSLYNAITACTSHSSTPDFLMTHHGSHFTIQCHHRLYQPLIHTGLLHSPSHHLSPKPIKYLLSVKEATHKQHP